MDAPDLDAPTDETVFAVGDWPMRLEATRDQLKKAQVLLEQYRAALRLARVEIERRNHNILTLTTFAYQASCAADPVTLLKLALARALEITDAPVGAIVLVDPETKRLALSIHRGLTTELSDILTGQELGAGASALMPHLVAGSGALLEYESSDDESEQMLLTAGRVSSLVSLPLQVGVRLIGALLVGLHGKRRFKPAELRFLMAISQEMAVALDSLRLRKELWQTAEALLDGKVMGSELQEADQAELNLEMPSLLDLPESTPTIIPEPAGEDLEQVLAAMMEAETEVRQQNTDLQTLNTIAEILNRTLNLKDILQCTVDQTLSVLDTDAAWIYLVEEGKQLMMRAHVGLSADYAHGMRRLKQGDGLEGRVAAENKVHLIESLSEDTHGHKIWVEREGLSALAAVPITRPEPEGQRGKADSHMVGVLATGRRGEQAYGWNSREVRLLTSIANHVALAIDNARLYARVQDDEVGLRAGNQVLREINDMLLQKNAFLEDFIQDTLSPVLTVSTQVLQHLQAKDAPPLTDARVQKYATTLQEVAGQLSELAEEAGMVSATLDTKFDELPGDEVAPDTEFDELPGDGDEEDSDDQAQPTSFEEGVEAKAEHLMTLEEAVAAGLIPGHALGSEGASSQEEDSLPDS